MHDMARYSCREKRRTCVIVIALSLLIVTSANAESLENCRAISSAVDRLFCYDQLGKSNADSSPEVERAKEAMRKALTDPESARFRNVVVSARDPANGVCGQVNFKNQMGGYVGFHPFVYNRQENRAMFIQLNSSDPAGVLWALDMWKKFCPTGP
jgi:hypothetical protein